MIEHDLRMTEEIDGDSLMAFCEIVWSCKPWSHNRNIAFYQHLLEQPALENGESPIVRLVRGDDTEALLCYLKYLYKGVTVYSGLRNKGIHGISLIRHWSRNCGLMFSAAPRSSSIPMYERAGWM